MMYGDSHTHTKFSHDGREDIDNVFKTAVDKGLQYVATTEHIDFDCLALPEIPVSQIDIEKYYNGFMSAKKQFGFCNTYFAFGAEFGYAKDVGHLYAEVQKKYDFDVVINSVHNIANKDPYFPNFFCDKKKEETYIPYLNTIAESINCAYDYDIVGHIGYLSRYAPYPDKTLYSNQFVPIIDNILKDIVTRDVAIEVNTNTKSSSVNFLPEYSILKKYYQLGGRKITTSSDAHDAFRIGEKFDIVAKMAKEIGFENFVFYKKRQPFYVDII